jgi:surfactin synthase thioesterase subunit
MTTSSTVTNAWIRRFHPSDDAPTRLVCLPHAGGSAPFFVPVSAALQGEVDVLAVQYPGRQDRRAEPCLESVQELAERIVPELEPWLDRPFALFGHSMGASIGFEVTRRLEELGTPPVALFASGRRAPSSVRDERVHLGDDDALIAELRGLSGTEPEILGDEELLRMILPALRGDYRVAETYRYRPGPPLSCPVVAMVGEDDPKVTLDEARAWEGHTSGPFTLRTFAGGHFFLVRHANEIIAELRERLSDHRGAR